MLKGFKDFIMRGNVIELAVAVVMGTAFTAIVTAFTKGIIDPLLASIGGSPDIGFGFFVREGNPATFINIGAIITAIINFLIVAAVIYFVMIAPMNKLAEITARRKGIAPEEAAATDVELLTEIRDLLREQRAGQTDPALQQRLDRAETMTPNGDDATEATANKYGRHAE
ncbi:MULTISPECIES: large conductance mechanosensitive channel protein MscL [Corynebacterium]|uniref:Large-conductance mechanosensitive channel n=1 Tax=Corynebacterium auriscanis TaxID=99807 RepID=A0A0A2DIP0_9CORY|nr:MULTISPECIES: large conductance mechanosensitive channel protein MscL [Corynebacterium]KGM19060.1 mechanosensitive ion channel protein MscL [Corynebacterium auriscanis]MCX2162315.1 large conductance mechanosensitive channel protein MscL [Corynebacterium auriscanis]OFT89927.1 mechanosensitive ion channel protein MscL [Corynebacterium sp. HMSC28B08]WJY73308.1 Large-conductance mechanosensitive channel [Corynebacterium auriscanis]